MPGHQRQNVPSTGLLGLGNCNDGAGRRFSRNGPSVLRPDRSIFPARIYESHGENLFVLVLGIYGHLFPWHHLLVLFPNASTDLDLQATYTWSFMY